MNNQFEQFNLNIHKNNYLNIYMKNQSEQNMNNHFEWKYEY